MLRNFFKYLLPYGVVEIVRNRRHLAALGRPLGVGEWLKGDRLVWETNETGLSLLPAGFGKTIEIVVDVGANIGQWSGMMLDILSPKQAIIIEPVPAAFAKLRENLGNRPNVKLINTVVGDRAGTVKFKVTNDTTGASVLQPKEQTREWVADNWNVNQEIDCPLDTLDHLLADLKEVSLLKIDVQGFEKAVLAGARETLKKTRFLLIELNYMQQYEQGSWFGEIHEILTAQHGFFLSGLSQPMRSDYRAIFSDGLYVNRALAPASLANPSGLQPSNGV